MQALDFFTSAPSVSKKVWRFMLPILGAVANFALSLSLRLRLTIRLLFPRKCNAFPGIQTLEVPVFVINLAKRPDRLREVTENLVGIGFSDVRVFEAIDGPKKYPGLVRGHSANLGCTESHMRVISDNLKKGLPIAVCEDDNEFLASPKEVHDLIREFLDSPHFDVLGLSTRSRGPKVKVSPDLDLVSWAMAPSFYIAKPRSRRQLMAAYHKSVSRLKAERRHGPFDQVWKTTQRLRLFFVRPTARVARQRESFSDIQGKFYAGT